MDEIEGTITISLKDYNKLKKYKDIIDNKQSIVHFSYGHSSETITTCSDNEMITILANKIEELVRELSKKRGWFK